jgi:hypothetical protein
VLIVIGTPEANALLVNPVEVLLPVVVVVLVVWVLLEPHPVTAIAPITAAMAKLAVEARLGRVGIKPVGIIGLTTSWGRELGSRASTLRLEGPHWRMASKTRKLPVRWRPIVNNS